jgi:hypothetical protein
VPVRYDAAVFMATSTGCAKLAGTARSNWYGSGTRRPLRSRWTVLAAILGMLVHGAGPVRTRKGAWLRQRWCLCSAYAWRSFCSIGRMRRGGWARAGADRTMRSA